MSNRSDTLSARKMRFYDRVLFHLLAAARAERFPMFNNRNSIMTSD